MAEIVVFPTAGLSILCCAAIVISFLRFEELRRPAYLMVLNLVVSDMGLAISFLLRPWPNDPKEGPLCTAQGIIQQYFELASPLWTAVMSYTLYRTVVQRGRGVWSISFRRYFCFAWGIPILATVIPFFVVKHPYVPASDDTVVDYETNWCWINRPQGASNRGTWFYLGMGTFYIPLWFVIGYNIYVTIAVLLHARKATAGLSDEDAAALKRLVRRLQWYPWILIICQLPATMSRVYPYASAKQGASDSDPASKNFFDSEPYYDVVVGLCSAQGALHAMAYGLTSSVRSLWKEECLFKFNQCCRCWRRITGSCPTLNVDCAPRCSTLCAVSRGTSYLPVPMPADAADSADLQLDEPLLSPRRSTAVLADSLDTWKLQKHQADSGAATASPGSWGGHSMTSRLTAATSSSARSSAPLRLTKASEEDEEIGAGSGAEVG